MSDKDAREEATAKCLAAIVNFVRSYGIDAEGKELNDYGKTHNNALEIAILEILDPQDNEPLIAALNTFWLAAESRRTQAPSTPVSTFESWIPEDELPKDYPYDAMFPFSKLGPDGRGGVRIFPKLSAGTQAPSTPVSTKEHSCDTPNYTDGPCYACAREKVLEWVFERYENCIRIAGQKTGDDKRGWMDDADHFMFVLTLLKQPSRTQAPSERDEEIAAWRSLVPGCEEPDRLLELMQANATAHLHALAEIEELKSLAGTQAQAAQPDIQKLIGEFPSPWTESDNRPMAQMIRESLLAVSRPPLDYRVGFNDALKKCVSALEGNGEKK